MAASSSRSTSERALIARIAAHSRWANTPDRSAATLPARQKLNERFEREVDPDGTMSPEDRARCVESARKAYYSRLALKSAQARRRKSQAQADIEAVAAELESGVG